MRHWLGQPGWVAGWFVSRDHRRLVSVAWDGVVRRRELTSGKEEPSPEGFLGHVQVVLSPNGRMIATSDMTGRVDTWDADAGVHLMALDNSGSISPKLAFSPDGNWLAVSQTDLSIHMLN